MPTPFLPSSAPRRHHRPPRSLTPLVVATVLLLASLLVLFVTPGAARAGRGGDLVAFGLSPDPLSGMARAGLSKTEGMTEEVADKIVNGVGTHGFPTTAALLYADGAVATPANAGAWCTATLVGCSTVLTAAHCVDDRTPSHYLVYLQNAGLYEVRSIAVHPDYAFPRADVAVLQLEEPVTGIAPTPLNTQVDPAQHHGTTGQIAGYGQTSGSGGDYGIKRAGEVTLASCDDGTGDLDDRRNVCWSFDAPIGAAGEDSNTCNGDSGGPLFANFGFGTAIAGVTSGGSDGDCGASGAGDHSFDANVYYFRSWITLRMGGDSTSACGGGAPVGSGATATAETSGSLSGGQQVEVRYQVGAGASSLVVALNGEDNGSLDVDLHLQQGDAVSPSDALCSVTGPGGFASCRVDAPAAGNWSVLVRAVSGSGQYQLTTTAFDATLEEVSEDGGGGGGGDGGDGGTDGPSCAGSCGDTPDGSCWCDDACTDYGDCCTDYQDQCTGGGGDGGGGGGGTTGPSCSGSCGDTPDGSCWCDASCVDYGDCCADYGDQCTGGGGGGGGDGGGGDSGGGDDGGTGGSCEDLVCADDPYCCEVEWDDLCDDAASWMC